MTMAETAEVAVKLSLDDSGFGRSINRIDKRLGAFSGAVNRNLGHLVDRGISAGINALSGAISSGLSDLATLETAVTSVDGAIAQMGLTGKVTGKQISGWANEIEASVGAAFDDKAITAAAATLIRYGKVSEKNLRPALVVMTDLAAKTGSVESASTLLARALADPAKAAGKLARAGVILTDQQQKQIKAMVKAGNVTGAQALLLDLLSKSTKGAAAASQGPYKRAMSVLADASEDAKKALAEGFLPVIERVADKLSKVLADPRAIKSIRDFGNSLAGAFDKAVTLAEGVDWAALGDGLKSAAGWAKRLFDAFGALPPETKGIIIGLAGLTKLTGGAPIKIAVDFAKDALGGVFGHFFDRGSSPANPIFVSGAGIGSGGPNPPGGGGSGEPTSKVGKVFDLASKVLIVGFVAELAQQLQPVVTGAGQDLHQAIVDAFDIKIKLPIPDPNDLQWPFGPKNTPTILPDIFGGNGVLGGTAAGGGPVGAASNARPVGEHAGAAAGIKTLSDRIVAEEKAVERAVKAGHPAEAARLRAKLNELKAEARSDAAKQKAATEAVKAKQAASLVAFRAGERASLTGNSLQRTANSRLEAIKNKRTKFTVNTHVNVNTSVSVSELKRQARYSSRVARTTGLSAS